TNWQGTTNGDDTTFRTAGLPVVVSESGTDITDARPPVAGWVVPSGFDTTCVCQYVDDATFQGTGYNTATSVDCSSGLGSGFDPHTATASVRGLTPSTTYHFRVVATNAAGTATGDDTTFKTLVSFLKSAGSVGGHSPGGGQLAGARGPCA